MTGITRVTNATECGVFHKCGISTLDKGCRFANLPLHAPGHEEICVTGCSQAKVVNFTLKGHFKELRSPKEHFKELRSLKEV